MARHVPTFLLALFVSACAGSTGGPGTGPSGLGKADGPGAATTLARCWIEAGASTGADVDLRQGSLFEPLSLPPPDLPGFSCLQ